MSCKGCIGPQGIGIDGKIILPENYADYIIQRNNDCNYFDGIHHYSDKTILTNELNSKLLEIIKLKLDTEYCISDITMLLTMALSCSKKLGEINGIK